MGSRVLNRKRANRPLRMDHSETHFENERLSEELENTVDVIHRVKHRQFINRAFEIMELKKTLTAFQSITKSNQKQNLLPHRNRPTSCFSSVVKVNVRLPVETGEEDTDDESLSSSDESSGRYRKVENKSRIVAGLDKTKDLPRGKPNPSEVYAKMLVCRDVPQRRPATSLPTMNSSTRIGPKTLRAKSAFPRSSTTETATVVPLNGYGDGTDKGMKMVCNRRAKSASMSVRRLKQMCNEDGSGSDDVQYDVIQARLEKARLESERLQVKVKMFLKSLDEWTSGKNKKSIRTYY